MRKPVKHGARVIAAVVIATGLLSSSFSPAAAAGDPWRDTTKTPAERAAALLDAMSFDEKVQVALDNFVPLTGYGLPSVLRSHDGPSGISVEGATAFPAALGLAATFDTDLAQRYGAAIAREARDNGSAIWLGPATDITRQPLSGRLAENLGEDPHLVGTIARAEVDGAKSQNVMTTVKHYGANVQEYARMGFVGESTDWLAMMKYCFSETQCIDVPLGYRTPAINENIPEQALREIYQAPVIATVKGDGADSVMCAYNQVNGLPACENPDLLSSLKSEFSGFVIPDYLAAQRDAVAAALAGTDIAGFDNGNQQRTAEMYTSGQIPEEILNDSDFRILHALFASGVYDNPAVATGQPVSRPEHVQLATEVAAKGMVLLKNTDNILPLSTSQDTSIAVIGPTGMDAIYTEGGSGPSVPVSAATAVTPLAGIQERAGGTTSVIHSQGSAGDIGATQLVPATWTAKFWDTAKPKGAPAFTRTDSTIALNGVPQTPVKLTTPFSATWTATIDPPETGLYRFTTLVSGDMTLAVNGKTVIDARKPTSNCGGGRDYPEQAMVSLEAGKPVTLEVKYSSISNTICVASNNINLAWQTPSQSQIPAAVAAAENAEVAIVVVNAASGEGSDRNTLKLPGDQNHLIEAVADANPRTVVVLNTAGPVLMPWLDKVEGVIQAWYPGQTFGTALAKVLYGDINPSGRLPLTFPASAKQGPVAATSAALTGDETGSLNFDEGIYVGYRWYDMARQTPLFPFGFGLSYTSFSYSNLTVVPDDTGATLTVDVRNEGSRAGTATPQFYLGAPTGDYDAQFARYSLAAYQRVTLDAGESETVSVRIDNDQLRYWDTASHSWQFAEGGRTISVGDSVRNITETVPLATPAVVPPDSTALSVLVAASRALLASSANQYTAESVAVLTAALDAADQVLADPTADQDTIDQSVVTIHAALGGLEANTPAVDKAVLQHVLDSASALSNPGGRYTTASWKQLQTAIGQAQQILDDPEASQAEVDQAIQTLATALSDLEPAAQAVVVEKIKLNQSQLQLVKGKSLRLEDGVYFANGVHPSYTGRVTWTSSNPKIATVNSNGTVKAKKPGTTTITVTTKDKTSKGKKLSTTIKVTVVKSKPKAKVTKVTASIPKTMKPGQVAFTTGKYTPAKVTGVKVTYSSSKPSVISVDVAGRLLAKSKGATTIKVKAGGKTKSYKITVK